MNNRIAQHQGVSQLSGFFECQAAHTLQNLKHLPRCFATAANGLAGRCCPSNGFQRRPYKDQSRAVVAKPEHRFSFIDLRAPASRPWT